MLFGGLQKLTTLDFPGVVGAVVFTRGCNFHCPYCHNPQLIPMKGGKPGPDPESIPAFLRKRRDVLDGLVISGGEPLLQPDLEAFCREVKALGYKIKLDTNGSLPRHLARLLDAALLDYVAVDLKTAPEQYAPILTRGPEAGENLTETFALLAASSTPFEARTTCFFPLTNAPALLGAATVLPPGAPWFLQRGNANGHTQSGQRTLRKDEETALLRFLQSSLPERAIAARPPFAE